MELSRLQGYTRQERRQVDVFWQQRYHDQATNPVTMSPTGQPEGGYGAWDALMYAKDLRGRAVRDPALAEQLNLGVYDTDHPVNQAYEQRQAQLRQERQNACTADRDRLDLQIAAERKGHHAWTTHEVLGKETDSCSLKMLDMAKRDRQQALSALFAYDKQHGHPLTDPNRDLQRDRPDLRERRQWMVEREGLDRGGFQPTLRQFSKDDREQAGLGLMPKAWMTTDQLRQNERKAPPHSGRLVPTRLEQRMVQERKEIEKERQPETPTVNPDVKKPAFKFRNNSAQAKAQEQNPAPEKDTPPAVESAKDAVPAKETTQTADPVQVAANASPDTKKPARRGFSVRGASQDPADRGQDIDQAEAEPQAKISASPIQEPLVTTRSATVDVPTATAPTRRRGFSPRGVGKDPAERGGQEDTAGTATKIPAATQQEPTADRKQAPEADASKAPATAGQSKTQEGSWLQSMMSPYGGNIQRVAQAQAPKGLGTRLRDRRDAEAKDLPTLGQQLFAVHEQQRAEEKARQPQQAAPSPTPAIPSAVEQRKPEPQAAPEPQRPVEEQQPKPAARALSPERQHAEKVAKRFASRLERRDNTSVRAAKLTNPEHMQKALAARKEGWRSSPQISQAAQKPVQANPGSPSWYQGLQQRAQGFRQAVGERWQAIKAPSRQTAAQKPSRQPQRPEQSQQAPIVGPRRRQQPAQAQSGYNPQMSSGLLQSHAQRQSSPSREPAELSTGLVQGRIAGPRPNPRATPEELRSTWNSDLGRMGLRPQAQATQAMPAPTQAANKVPQVTQQPNPAQEVKPTPIVGPRRRLDPAKFPAPQPKPDRSRTISRGMSR